MSETRSDREARLKQWASSLTPKQSAALIVELVEEAITAEMVRFWQSSPAPYWEGNGEPLVSSPASKVRVRFSRPIQEVLTLGIKDWGRQARSFTQTGVFDLEVSEPTTNEHVPLSTRQLICDEIRRKYPLEPQEVEGIIGYSIEVL